MAIGRKIIFQWHSELRSFCKKCCAGVLEVMCKCPYLCTTPQGRDGGNATEIGGRTGDTAGGTLPAREAEKGPRKLFQNKFCGFEKSSYLCSPNQGKRRWARCPEPTEMTVQECSNTLRHKAEARSGGEISSLNDHVAQRSFRKEAYAEKIYKINQFRYPGAGGKH